MELQGISSPSSSPLAGEEGARAEGVGRRGGRHDIGLVLAIVFTFLLALPTEWMSAVILARRPDTFSLVALALMASPLLLAFVAIGISLARRPLWVRVSVAIFLLLVPPAFVFSGVLNG